MRTTKHNLVRMSQRGITRKMIETVVEWGFSRGDKITLDVKSVRTILNEMDELRKVLLKVSDKGGVTVVMSDDLLITTYNTDSYKSY